MGKSSVGMGQLGVKYSNYREMQSIQLLNPLSLSIAFKQSLHGAGLRGQFTIVAGPQDENMTGICRHKINFSGFSWSKYVKIQIDARLSRFLSAFSCCSSLLLRYKKFGSWPPISPTAHGPFFSQLANSSAALTDPNLAALGILPAAFPWPPFPPLVHLWCTFATFATFDALSLASFGLTGLAFTHLARTGGLFLSCGSALVPDVRRLGGNNGNMMLLLGIGQTTQVKLVGGFNPSKKY